MIETRRQRVYSNLCLKEKIPFIKNICINEKNIHINQDNPYRYLLALIY